MYYNIYMYIFYENKVFKYIYKITYPAQNTFKKYINLKLKYIVIKHMKTHKI